MTLRTLRHAAAGLLFIAFAATISRGQDPLVKYASFAELDVKSPEIAGTLWIDVQHAETIQQIDRDGDFVYSQDELNTARGAIELYLRRMFNFLWQERMQPLRIVNLAVAPRNGTGRPYLKIDFRVGDFAPNQDVAIVSRLLSDLYPDARTVARIRCDSRDQVIVLSPEDYFASNRVPPGIPADSPFRPAAQRGRIAGMGSGSPANVEMLYALPEGAFYLYCLEADRYTPAPIEDRTLSVQIQPNKTGDPRTITLDAKPLPADKPGRASRFCARMPELASCKQFNADVRFGTGADARRLIFEFPAVTIRSASEAVRPRRFGCPRLCLGVERSESGGKCPRCGAALVELRGAPIPGLGTIGRHGGQMVPADPRGHQFEALLAKPDEFRLYLTNEKLDLLDVGELTGTVHFSTDENFQQTVVEIALHKAPGGKHLTAKIPETVKLPIRARYVYDFRDGTEMAQVDFFFQEVTPVAD